jgi:hypothetical protein
MEWRVKKGKEVCPRQMPELTEPGRKTIYRASEGKVEPIPR